MQRSMILPSGHVVKNNAQIMFEKRLDLNDLILSGSVPDDENKRLITQQFAKLSSLSIKEEKPKQIPLVTVLTPDTPSTNGIKLEQIGSSLKQKKSMEDHPFHYQITAVILHYGHHESGHFVALRRVIKNGKEMWFRVSDSHVDRIVDVDGDVFEHGSRHAYMIFYERI
jgi:ubiquitin C-terminal hydrolase